MTMPMNITMPMNMTMPIETNMDNIRVDKNESTIKLTRLCHYLKNNHGINANVDLNIRYRVRLDTVSQVYARFLSVCFLIILVIIIYIQFIKYKYDYPIVIAIFVIILLILAIKFINNLFKLTNNNINYNNFINKKVMKMDDSNISKLRTGDILQEEFHWNQDGSIFYSMLNFSFIHTMTVFVFEGDPYILHFHPGTFDFPEVAIYFSTKYMNVCLARDYFIDNHNAVRYYKFIRIRKKIDENNVFRYIKKIDDKKNNIIFSVNPILYNYRNTEQHKFHCVSFVLNLLIFLKLINTIQVQVTTPDELIHLYRLSNGSYHKSVIVKVY